MTLVEFERTIYAVVAASPICGVPLVRRLTATSINVRIDVVSGGFIDAFYNEETDTTAYTWIQRNRRVFGADNTGGWHPHPFHAPERHFALSGPMTFQDFVAAIEQQPRR